LFPPFFLYEGSVAVTLRFVEHCRKQSFSIANELLVTDDNFTYALIDDCGHPQVIKQGEPPISA
jgi:hypothetical protein